MITRSKIVSNPLRCRLDHACALPAVPDPGDQGDYQRAADHQQHPVMLAGPGMMRNAGILVQCGDRQHHDRVPAGEERPAEPAEERPPVDRIAREVVDRSEMVGIRAVPQAQREDRERTEADHAGSTP